MTDRFADAANTDVAAENKQLRAKLARVNRFVCWFAAVMIGFSFAVVAISLRERDAADTRAYWLTRRIASDEWRQVELERALEEAEWLRAACEEALDWKVAR